MLVDLKEKKKNYLDGVVPFEDDDLKRILSVVDNFINKVNRAIFNQRRK